MSIYALFDDYFLVVLDVYSLHWRAYLLALEVVDAIVGIGSATDARIAFDDNLADACCLVIAGEDEASCWCCSTGRYFEISLAWSGFKLFAK